VADYVGYDLTGSHMDSDGGNLQVLESSGAGWVSLGITRLGATGIDFNGTRTVVKLQFSPASSTTPATGSFDFANTQVLGSQTPPQVKGGITWFGGTLVIS
jgi:hypothetical protein